MCCDQMVWVDWFDVCVQNANQGGFYKYTAMNSNYRTNKLFTTINTPNWQLKSTIKVTIHFGQNTKYKYKRTHTNTQIYTNIHKWYNPSRDERVIKFVESTHRVEKSLLVMKISLQSRWLPQRWNVHILLQSKHRGKLLHITAPSNLLPNAFTLVTLPYGMHKIHKTPRTKESCGNTQNIPNVPILKLINSNYSVSQTN